MPTFLYEKFHLTLTTAGCYAVIFIQLASAISTPCSGWIADRLSLKTKHGRILVQLLALLFGTATIVAIGKIATLAPLIIAMILFGIFKGAYDVGLYSSLFNYIDPKLRGSGVGLIISLGYFIGALGPALVGAISTYGHSGSAISRMGATISASAPVYAIAALLLVTLLIVTRKEEVRV